MPGRITPELSGDCPFTGPWLAGHDDLVRQTVVDGLPGVERRVAVRVRSDLGRRVPGVPAQEAFHLRAHLGDLLGFYRQVRQRTPGLTRRLEIGRAHV